MLSASAIPGCFVFLKAAKHFFRDASDDNNLANSRGHLFDHISIDNQPAYLNKQQIFFIFSDEQWSHELIGDLYNQWAHDQRNSRKQRACTSSDSSSNEHASLKRFLVEYTEVANFVCG